MRIRMPCALLLVAFCASAVKAEWLTWTGGPSVAVGNWPATASYAGTAAAKQSLVVNGIPSTPPIGLLPLSIGNLSSDYFATSLVPNPGPVVDSISTPYNDTGDKYHVLIDFSGTTGSANPGVLPAGSIFAIIDLDIHENYRNVQATDFLGNPILTPWISGPNGYFDMTNPMTPQGSFPTPQNPTFSGPVAGVYQMFGVPWNDDSQMWLFKTTQDVKTIAFDMEVGVTSVNVGGGGAAWAFYSKPGPKVPEPTIGLLCGGLVIGGSALRLRRRISNNQFLHHPFPKDSFMNSRNSKTSVAALLGAVIALVVCAGTVQAQFTINFDEFGKGTVTSTAGTVPLPSLGNIQDPFDPNSGIHPLAYNLAGAIPGVVPFDGDINLFEPPQATGVLSDLLRWTHGLLLVYSDLPEPNETPVPLADVGLPGTRQAPLLNLPETGPEIGPNGLFGYTPNLGDPGYYPVPPGPVTYNFTSDGAPVPEPCACLLMVAGLMALFASRRRAA